MMTSASAADLLCFPLSLPPHPSYRYSSSCSSSSYIPLLQKRRRNAASQHPFKLLSHNFPNRRRSTLSVFAKAVDFKAPLTESVGPDGDGEPNSTVLLDVTGMMCGACVSRVKSILSSDDRVDSVVVNMLTETAAIKLKKAAELPAGEEFAEKLTQCGFPTKMRESGLGIQEKVKKWR